MTMATGATGIRQFLRYTLTHAPWALISSLSAGLSNYVVTIMLAKFYGLATSGQFRLLLSVFGMLSLFTLMDSGKIAIKYLVQGEKGVIRPLIRQRILWGQAGLAIGLVTAFVYYLRGDAVWLPLLAVALCVPLAKPATMYAQINQARKQFRRNAFYSVIKYGTITLAAFVLGWLHADPVWFLCLFFLLTCAFNMAFLARHEEAFEPGNANAAQYRRESLQLSASGIFPILLEHADKFLISYFFGLQVLGLYVIGVSTGRLLLHFVKPTLTIYFPLLVKQRLARSILVFGFFALTAAGLLTDLGLRYYFSHVLGAAYMDAAPLAMVIVSGLGVYFVGVVVYYSAVYHQDSTARIPAITNIATALLIISYMAASVSFGGDYALLLCAASYPLRELINLIVIKLLNARMTADENPRPVL